jgi:flavin reductase (DIM6/NTAB) family NADH-FMN oxidoreductase RutF
LPLDQLDIQPLTFFDKDWLLLSAGEFATGEYNTMTISWGSLGTLWGRPIAMVVVRPARYTYRFMEKAATFTLCAFSGQYRKALNLLGVKSGRDGDKIAEAGLTPMPATRVGAPVFAEARLALECRKLYWQDLQPSHFLDPTIERLYPEKDYHRMYIGEILAITQEND